MPSFPSRLAPRFSARLPAAVAVAVPAVSKVWRALRAAAVQALSAWGARWRTAGRARQVRAQLAAMSDHQLRDLGLGRDQIAWLVEPARLEDRPSLPER